MTVASLISRSTKRWISLFAVALLLIGAVSVNAQTDGGTLKVGMNAPVKLDPALNSNDPETAFNRALYDFLIDVKPDATLAPDLADSWTVSADSLTYTFKIHPGVTFHDGSALTAKDVVFSFNRLVTAGSPAVGLLGKFDVSATDDSTVVFKLPEVNADFLYGVGSRWAFIIKDGQDAPNVLAEGSATPMPASMAPARSFSRNSALRITRPSFATTSTGRPASRSWPSWTSSTSATRSLRSTRWQAAVSISSSKCRTRRSIASTARPVSSCCRSRPLSTPSSACVRTKAPASRSKFVRRSSTPPTAPRSIRR